MFSGAKPLYEFKYGEEIGKFLYKYRIRFSAQLQDYSEEELISMSGFKKPWLNELKKFLQQSGIKLRKN